MGKYVVQCSVLPFNQIATSSDTNYVLNGTALEIVQETCYRCHSPAELEVYQTHSEQNWKSQKTVGGMIKCTLHNALASACLLALLTQVYVDHMSNMVWDTS